MTSQKAVYLDCNATTPLEPEARATLLRYLDLEIGNAASHTHEYGAAASKAVQRARQEVSQVAGRGPEEVIFTSGATESNNLAILGLANYGIRSNKKHIVTTSIEHKSVLEPIRQLEKRGFEVSRVPPDGAGRVDPAAVAAEVRSDTLLVSVMHANNETGVIQPVEEISQKLPRDVFFHVDAAQGFCKELAALLNPRIDMISVSAHKVYGPKGVGALIANREAQRSITPRQFGGGQERGLRPGTVPVPLIAAMGTACSVTTANQESWRQRCEQLGRSFHQLLLRFGFSPIVDSAYVLPNTLLVAHEYLTSDVVIMSLRESIAISTGSACTSNSDETSHVLKAMGLSDQLAEKVVRFSWCHFTEDDSVEALKCSLQGLPR